MPIKKPRGFHFLFWDNFPIWHYQKPKQTCIQLVLNLKKYKKKMGMRNFKIVCNVLSVSILPEVKE